MGFFILLFFLSNSEEIFIYSGDRIFFNVDSSFVLIYGNAKTNQGKLSLSADSILYDLNKKKLTAKGEVVFNDGSSEIKAKEMSYDVDREIGDAYQAKTEVENGWFFGKRIRYFKEGSLKIKDGYYTTCELDPPHYWFYSPRMRINIDESLVAEPVILLVQDIPVFFVPFYFQSIKKERASGLLRPEFGTSFYGGNYIKKIGWYQTLGPHADLIFYSNYYTKKGISFHIDEFRWNLLPYSIGDFSGSYIKERESGKERWLIRGNTKGEMWGIRLNADTRLESDRDYTKDYEPGEVEKILEKEINYSLSWNGEILGARTDFVLDHRENLTTEEIYKRWPSVNLTFPTFKIGFVNFRSFYKFVRDETNHWASGFSGRTNLNFNLYIFNLNMGISGESDYYERENITINHWESSMAIKTNIYGVSFFGIPPISKFRHIVTPSVSFSYAPYPKEVEVSPIAEFSLPYGQRSFILSLSNLFQCKIRDKRYDFASINFSTNYRQKEKEFSPISINGSFWIGDFLKQDYSTSYDIKGKEFGSKRVNTYLEFRSNVEGNPFDLYLRHSIDFTKESRIQQADLGVGFNPTPNWILRVNAHYDFERNKITNTSVDLNRDLHCWRILMSVNKFGEDWDYRLSFELKGIPEVKITRETLGGLMP
ncbi:MAG: putative LPS assembly protein LptD [candidate division WOR-3 bacterium]